MNGSELESPRALELAADVARRRLTFTLMVLERRRQHLAAVAHRATRLVLPLLLVTATLMGYVLATRAARHRAEGERPQRAARRPWLPPEPVPELAVAALIAGVGELFGRRLGRRLSRSGSRPSSVD